MKKDTKKALYQVGTFGMSYSTGSKFNNSGTSPSITENINGMSISDVNRYEVPSVRPYGIASVPPDNVLQVVGHMGASGNNLAVIGHLMVLNNHILSLSPLGKGEIAVYSRDSAFVVGSGKMQYLYNQSLTSTPISGEWSNKIFVDIITYLQQVVQKFMTQMVNIYNNHTHPVYHNPDITGVPNQQLQSFEDLGSSFPPPFPDNLVSDLQAAQTGQTLINSSGTAPQMEMEFE